MFKLFLSFVLAILCSQVGEEVSGAPAAPAEMAAPADNGDGSGEPGQAQPPADDPNNHPATPKYGDFGDDPDALYAGHTKLKTEYDNFRRKQALTEGNLSELRKSINETAQKLNARPVFDARGRLAGFEPIEAKPSGKQRTVRFNDEAMNELGAFFDKPESGKKFIGLITNLIQDKAEEIAEQMLEQGFEPRFKQHYERIHTERANFNKAFQSTRMKVEKIFPGALNTLLDGSPNPNFDEKLSERAKEILESNEEYQKAPNGLLLAVADAAAELGITPQVTEPIKREAFKQGKESAKILGPVQPGHNKPGSGGGFKKLSPEEFKKLSPEEKAKYQKDSVGLS